jgi:LuxR family maltose regulon positive regulatory protein
MRTSVARPVIATKLYVPRRRHGLVPRPRLDGLLRRGAEARLTLVSAPAGFGKTTLLAGWLGEPCEGRRVAWVSLDPTDDDAESFWTYVLTALRTAVPAIGPSVQELLASFPLPTDLVVTAVVNELAASPDQVWLVLDDYHVIDNREIHDGISFLLDHLPPTAHVVISTRADPDLPLPRWRARRELVEVRAADLRFTPAEAAAYLHEVAGPGLTEADVTTLEERTEGWIAALQLAALSIQGRADAGGFIARFAGTDRYVVDYLVEEVLQQQPEAVRDFLLQSSVLDRFTGPLCDALTGRGDGSTVLVALERANLFIVPLDDRREWYRYHHLFADVLRAHLLGERPGQVRLLHRSASHWYETHDLMPDAVRHALAAGDHDRAAQLMERALPSMRRYRQDALLAQWLTALPDETVRRSPVLNVFYGSMLLASGEVDAVGSRLDDAERALAAGPDPIGLPWADTEELRTLPATIAVYRASLAQARGDVTATQEHARRALALAGPDDHLARGGAAGFLGLAAWAAGDVSAALETFTQAVASLHAAGNLVDELSSTVVLADLWLAGGRPSRARDLYHRALERAEAERTPVGWALADLHVGLSELDREVADLDDARRHLQTAAALAERAGTTAGRFRWFVAMARVADAEGDPGQALALLDQAEQLYRPGYFPDVRPVAAMKARVRIAHGDLSAAAGWVRERGVSATAGVSYLSEFDHLTLVRLLIARHRADQDPESIAQAIGLLDRLEKAAEAHRRAGSLVEIRLLQALAHAARADRVRAREALARAFAEAPEPENLGRLFLDEGEPMIRLLRDAENRGLAGGHPGRLLRLGTSAATAAMDANRRAAPSSANPLSDRELQVLRLLAGELTGPQIARELFVSLNTLRTHTKQVFTKLDVTSRRAAVRRARELGLL